MPDLQKAKDALARAEAALAEVKAALNDEAAPTPAPAPAPQQQATFDNLKAVLETDRWPVCANKNLVCDPSNEADKVQRGRGVVELMVEGDLSGKKFLDFGCGEGHSAVYVATKGATLSVGFDSTPQNWEGKSAANLKLTSNWDEVAANGPYDAILIFDVIDHLVGTTPVEVLIKAKSILADNGRIYVRTHPFTARHALHNYHDLNKGFVHLVFTQEELNTLLAEAKYTEPNNGVKFPLASYKGYFDQAGLEVVTNRPVKDAVEPFFKAPAIAERIMKNLGITQFPEFQMSMQFIDYVLKKPDSPQQTAQ